MLSNGAATQGGEPDMFNKNNESTIKRGGPPPGQPTVAQPAVAPPPVAPPPEPARGPAEASVINRGLKVVGNLVSDGGIEVSGTVEGDISSATLTVSEGATVKGTINVESAAILGRVEGEVRSRAVRIAATGQVVGDVKYETMAIEEGAEIEGRIGKVAQGQDGAGAPARKAADGADAGKRAPATSAAAGGSRAAAKP